MITRLVALTGFMVVSVFVVAGLLGSAGAQELATPTAGAPDHPAHIHSGSCATLGDVEFPLANVTLASDSIASPEASLSRATIATPAAAGEFLTSTTTVETTLDDLLGGEHAINVHESDANIQTYIACGDITGEATDGMLTVTLQELNGSDLTGQAMLTDNGDGTTTVTIEVTSAAATAAFAPGDVVVVADGGVNLRADATTAADIVRKLEGGEALEIQGGPVEADGYSWYEVIVSETGEVGWVAATDTDGTPFIEPAA